MRQILVAEEYRTPLIYGADNINTWRKLTSTSFDWQAIRSITPRRWPHETAIRKTTMLETVWILRRGNGTSRVHLPIGLQTNAETTYGSDLVLQACGTREEMNNRWKEAA